METDKQSTPQETPAVEPAVVVPAASEPVEVKTEPARKSFWMKMLPWAIVALVFFLGGMALIYFTLYQNATDAVKAADMKVAGLQSELSQVQGKLTTEKETSGNLQTELDGVKAELTTAQGTIETQTAEILKAQQLQTIYKFLADVNTARAVLESLDVNSTRQAINFAKADLVELEATGIEAASISGFKDRLDEAETKLGEPDLLTSRAALNTLYQNILLLIDNLK